MLYQAPQAKQRKMQNQVVAQIVTAALRSETLKPSNSDADFDVKTPMEASSLVISLLDRTSQTDTYWAVAGCHWEHQLAAAHNLVAQTGI